MFALGHIYTHMTFGLFTNITSRALGKHIYKYVPASGEYSHRVSFIRSVTGYSSSGSVAGVSLIRISPGIHHPAHAGSPSSGSLRVSIIRSVPGLLRHPVLTGLAGLVHPVLTGSPLPAPDIPSGGTVILTCFTPTRIKVYEGLGPTSHLYKTYAIFKNHQWIYDHIWISYLKKS